MLLPYNCTRQRQRYASLLACNFYAMAAHFVPHLMKQSRLTCAPQGKSKAAALNVLTYMANKAQQDGSKLAAAKVRAPMHCANLHARMFCCMHENFAGAHA
jgi:hypothetical protein